MKSFIHRRGFRNYGTQEPTFMKALIKKGITSLIEGWGKRQLVKAGAVVVPLIGVTQADWNATAAVIVASVLMLVEIIFSKLNAKRLKEAAAPALVD